MIKITLKDFLNLIKNKKIIDCYLANTEEEKKDTFGLSKYGMEKLQKAKLLKYHNVKSVDVDFDYGLHSFVLELENGLQIIVRGTEWNVVELDNNEGD